MIFFRALVILSLLGMSIHSQGLECINNTEALETQGREYFSRAQFLLATQQLSFVSLMACSESTRENGRLRWGQALFELGEANEGLKVLAKIPKNSPLYDQALLTSAWYQRDLKQSLGNDDQKRLSDYDLKISQLPQTKKPWLAGSLSAILPGSGQTYNGNFQSGLFAFALNALFLSATLELERKGLHSTALTSGVLFSVVYVGNIVGAAQGSKAINEKVNANAKEDIKNSIFPELSF